MPLTRRQLEQISEIVSRRLTAFTYEALGERALTSVELNSLRELGIVRDEVRHLVMDPVVLGRITALVPPSSRHAVTYDTVLQAAKNVELTEIERHAIDFATSHAGEHIKGIRDMMVRDVRTVTARAGEAALRAVQENVAASIASRETISQLKTRLFDAIDNRTKDWQRVAHTEINTAVQQGVYRSIRDNSDEGENQLVYKRPAPDACRHCKRLYLKADGTPRVFRLKDLADSNVGRRAVDWEPVIGSVHPWCACQLQVIPEGYDFVKRRVVIKGFELDGHAWLRGSVVDDATWAKMDETLKSHVGTDAVLSYTGKTAQPDVEKSFAPAHDDGDDCICEHD